MAVFSLLLPKEFDYFTAVHSSIKLERAGLHKWRCKTFSITDVGESTLQYLVKTDSWISCIYITGLKCNSYFFPTCLDGYIDSNKHFPAYKMSWPGSVQDQVCFHHFNANGHSSSSVHTRSPALKTRITFAIVNNFASVFLPLHSTFLPIFSAHKVLSP